MTFNGDVFYYDYQGYQISQIVDRTAINLNFNATVKGAELESSWEPIPGLKFNFAGGYEDTRVANGQQAIDLMDRTAGHSGWMVVRPFPTQTSSCILPTTVVNQLLSSVRAQDGGNTSTPGTLYAGGDDGGVGLSEACFFAYSLGIDPGLSIPFNSPDTGFDPTDPTIAQETHNGEGFAKNLGGNQLPNAPHFTTSLSGDYTMPLSEDWAGTIHGDFYWQSQSFARIFNDRPYDKLRGYSTTNLALIFTNANGWQVMGYVKNIFNKTAITGAFLYSDDTGLPTNIFTTDPRLMGVRITKNF